MIYSRNCPVCKAEIEYKNIKSFKLADKNKNKCRKCYSKDIQNTLKERVINGKYIPNIRPKNSKVVYKHFRNCPNCKKEIPYSRKDIMVRAKKNNTVCNSCSAYKYNKTFKNNINNEHIKQMRATKAGFSNWEEYVEKYPKKEFYKREVWKHTYKNNLTVLENFDKRGKCGVIGAYQIDHITSINYGWENSIPPEEIGHIKNLKMIPWQENRKKGK